MSKAKPNLSDNTGKGKDRKGTKRDGLIWYWSWSMQCQLSGGPKNDRRRLPCQCCHAKIKTKYGELEIEATDWHSSYGVNMSLGNDYLVTEYNFPTRLAAQIRAEELPKEFFETVLQAIELRHKT